MKRLFLIMLLTLLPCTAAPSESVQRPATGLDQRVESLERRMTRRITREAASFFLFGVVCALWAQNTGRNAWLWFFLGVFFNIAATLVLLGKNSRDRRIQPA